jgi:transcription factor IIIB subunit 2
MYVDRAYRLYQLALQRNFIFGRRQAHVVATCLYIICRQEKSPHLLIDFSDALQVNVYVLGKSFLQFSKVLNLNLPVIDPSLYIHRYATRLQLGDKMSNVITTSLRIVTRLKKDWITTGRRPDGICAVAMLIAARAYGFNISQGVVSKIFRISGETLKRRLDDFKATPSAQLTLVQFNVHDLDVEFDPPSFIRGVVDASAADGQSDVALSLPPRTEKARVVGGGLTEDDDSEGERDAEEQDLENDEVYRLFNGDNGDSPHSVQRTRIGDVNIAVPVPGHGTSRSMIAIIDCQLYS